jgi:hypothetical protein
VKHARENAQSQPMWSMVGLVVFACLPVQARDDETPDADPSPAPLHEPGESAPAPTVDEISTLGARLLVADDRVRTFVARLDGADLSPSLVDTLVDVVVGSYSEDTRRQVVGPRDVATVLDWKRTEAVLGCDDDCASEIGAALDAERLVVGTLRPIGDDVHVSLRELDLKTGESKSSIEDVLPLADTRALVYGMRRLAQRVRDGAGIVVDTKALGALSIDTPMPGALVVIDDNPIGSTPLTSSALAPGLHAIRVDQGDSRAEFVIDVIAREKTDVVVELVPTAPSYALRDVHAAQVRRQTLFGAAKLLCASAYGCAGAGCASIFVWGAIDSASYGVNFGIPTSLGIAAGVIPALALAGWGAYEIATLPDEPRGPVPIHRVTITPPEGHGRVRVIPVRDTRETAVAF